ncbi:hypothetical protein [Micromonospora marina]|uniref:hypothetical protein n=1 Tax=Micromonospora marina TaxID=307120 RepID=UPI0034553CE8
MGGVMRWMYRGGRPNRLARTMNALSAWQYGAGLAPHRPVRPATAPRGGAARHDDPADLVEEGMRGMARYADWQPPR